MITIINMVMEHMEHVSLTYLPGHVFQLCWDNMKECPNELGIFFLEQFLIE